MLGGDHMIKIIDWNIAGRKEPWNHLLASNGDIALVQEATEPPKELNQRLEVDSAPWLTSGVGVHRPWRAAVVKLSKRVGVQWLEAKSLVDALPGELAVSRPGTLAAALVTTPNGEAIIVISIYAIWEEPHQVTGSNWIYADGSVHRLISDISAFIGRQSGHRVLVAGDLNILHGYGEKGNTYWAFRYATVFERMSAIGLTFVGPQSPNGRLAEPWPKELPQKSNNVPTYYTNRQSPATATRQLDFVFASNNLVEHVHVRALNDPDDWGPSDHCRVEIEID